MHQPGDGLRDDMTSYDQSVTVLINKVDKNTQ